MDTNFTEKKVSLQLTETEAAFVYELLAEGDGNITTYTWQDQGYFGDAVTHFIAKRENKNLWDEDLTDEQEQERDELTAVLEESVANLHEQLAAYKPDFT